MQYRLWESVMLSLLTTGIISCAEEDSSRHQREPAVIMYRAAERVSSQRPCSRSLSSEPFSLHPGGSIFYYTSESLWNWAVFPVEPGQLKKLLTNRALGEEQARRQEEFKQTIGPLSSEEEQGAACALDTAYRALRREGWYDPNEKTQ